MRTLTILSVVVVLLAGLTNVAGRRLNTLIGYHEVVGIPEAERIKRAEEHILAANENPDNEGSRIVGGVVTLAHRYPYLAGLIVSIVGQTGRSVCGSTILTTNRLVTAAHCWFDSRKQASQFEAVFGSHFLFFGGTRMVTSDVVTHPYYNSATYSNDIAMVYLPDHVEFSAIIQPVHLPSSALRQSFDGIQAIAAGFGMTSDVESGVSEITQVNHVSLRVISMAECQLSFGWWVKDSNICTSGVGGVGICGGDSGGPLVVKENGKEVLIGISSFVANTGCQMGHPSVFASVASFRSFILEHL